MKIRDPTKFFFYYKMLTDNEKTDVVVRRVLERHRA